MRWTFHVWNIIKMFAMLLIVQAGGSFVGLEGPLMFLTMGVFATMFLEMVGPILSISWDDDVDLS